MAETSGCNPDAIERIKKYLAEKIEWQQNVPEIIVPGSLGYEAFMGDRGEANKKAKQRISMGILEEGEGQAADEKSSGDAAFRAGRFQEAADHYARATDVWGHPHNAVCHSNLAAALLKLEKWSEAEIACQKALREHLSIHGEHYGIFHIKVFHRLGLANDGMGRYEVAELYFEKALKISPKNAAVRNDMKNTANARLRARDASPEKQREAWKTDFGLTELEIDHILQAGGKPWDEDVQDMLECGGLRDDTLTCLTTKPGQRPEDPHGSMDNLRDSMFKSGCFYCGRGPTIMPLWTCRGCGGTAYCSHRCAIRHFQIHTTICGGNRETLKKLSTLKRDDIDVFRRSNTFANANSTALQKVLMVTLGMLGPEGVADRTAFERFVCVIDLAYEGDASKPLQVLGVRKVLIEEMERKVSELSDMGSRLKEINRLEQDMGSVGTAASIVLVQDGEWNCAQVQTFTMPKDFFEHAPPPPEEGWVQGWIDDINALERDRHN